MRITALRRQRRFPHRYSVFLDGTYAFSLSEETVLRHHLEVDTELDEDGKAQVLADDEITQAKEAALQYLSYRPRTRKEIRDKLRGKGYEARVIEDVLGTLERLRLVDDGDFATRWIEERLRLKPRGRRLLLQELRKKGISGEQAEQAIEDAFREVRERDLALMVLRKRRERYRRLERVQALRRMYGFLARRGFDVELARDVIQEIARELFGDEIE